MKCKVVKLLLLLLGIGFIQHPSYSMEYTYDYPWLGTMSTHAKILIKQLHDVLQAVAPQVSKGDFAQATYDCNGNLVKSFIHTVRQLYLQIGNPEVKEVPEYKRFLLKHVLEKLTSLEGFRDDTYDSLSQDRRINYLNQAFTKLTKEEPELIKGVLRQLYQDDPAAIVHNINSLASFDPGSQPLKDMYNSHDDDVQKLAHQLFFKWSRNCYTLNVSQLKVAQCEHAPLAVLQDIARTFDTLVKYTLTQPTADNAAKEITVWVPYDREHYKALISPEVVRQLFKRSLVTLASASLFKSGKASDSIKQCPLFDFDNPCTLYIFNTSLPKYFPIKTGSPVFTAEHINSAEFNNPPPELKLFRSEEIGKTLIHELFHRIQLEWLLNGNKEIITHFSLSCPDGSPLLLNEALVEAMASLVNGIMTTCEAADMHTEQFDQYFEQMWSLEKSFSFYQTAKILYISNFRTFEEFLSPTTIEHRVIQTTNAVEYHILKAALLYNVNDFLKIMLKNDNDSTEPSKEHFTQQITDLILKTCHSTDFAQKVNMLLTWLYDNQPNDMLFKTGRMTIIEKDLGLTVQDLS
jgi:hypothetical protein